MAFFPDNNNIEMVLEAVKEDGSKLMLAGDIARNNFNVVMTAVKQDVSSFQYASDELKKNHEMVLAVMEISPDIALRFSSEDLKNDRAFQLASLKKGVHNLSSHASDVLKNDYTFMLEVVHLHPSCFPFCSRELRSNGDFVIDVLTVKNCHVNLFALTLDGGCLMSDRTFMLRAIELRPHIFNYASKELKSDRTVALAALNHDGEYLELLSNELKNDREIVLTAVNQCGLALKHASDELKNDREIVFTALNNHGPSLFFCSDLLQQDMELITVAAANCFVEGVDLECCEGVQCAYNLVEQGNIANYVQTVLHNWHTFHDVFLSGWMMRIKAEEEGSTTPPFTTSLCKLPLLNKLGKYALIDVKKRIAAYAGVCYGKSLIRAQQAQMYFSDRT
jgi:hypothetical protein